MPVYWILPSAKVLLFAQAAALGSGAVPTFLLAREKLRDEMLAVVLAVAYLLHPALGHMSGASCGRRSPTLVGWSDHRDEIYMFPNPFSASYWGTFTQEGQRLPQADRVEYVIVPTMLDPEPQAVFDRIRQDFDVVYQAGNVTLVKKKPASPG